MKISANWIREYAAVDWSADELADRLTMSGLEVEDVDRRGEGFDGVVVGRVLEVAAHPNADRLTVCRVETGPGSEPVSIVCGAPNVAAGQLVPVATVGTTLMLPDRKDPSTRVPVTLRRAKIRGEVSEGMICAEDELGLSDDHSGIMVLDAGATPGMPFASYLLGDGGPDAVLDVSITPNRPDAISHLGVARDVSALSGVPLVEPDVTVPGNGGEAAGAFSVAIEAPDGCHRYVGILVRGVSVGESPAWLRRRLEAIGLRPRNNVVDITNYVMYECGQPLHAFDFDQLAGRRIVVRRTEGETRFTTLDSKERTLPAGTLMIADGARDVAIAGVMGGENSEVTAATRDVLIESAYFEPLGIRRTAKALQLQTDASYRFERGIDPTRQAWAAARAADLMVRLAGGTLVPGMVDAHPVPHVPRTAPLRRERISAVLGVAVDDAEIERLLTAIGFGIEPASGGWSVVIPPFRPDVEREIDVVEEIARLHGLDRIPEPVRATVPTERPTVPPSQPLLDTLSDLLAGLGYREAITNSMLRVDVARTFLASELRGEGPVGTVVETLNPISQEMAALRPSLLPGALQVLAHNLNHGQKGVRLFEFGTVFDRLEEEDAPVPPYRERRHLLISAAGRFEPPTWDAPGRDADLFDLKGAAERVLRAAGITDAAFIPEAGASGATSYRLSVEAGGRRIGTVARLAEAVTDGFDLRVPVHTAELDFGAMVALAQARGIPQYRPVPRFPSVERDLALVVPRAQPVGPLLDTIRDAGGPLLQDVSMFDLYEGDRIEAGSKSAAFSLRFGAERTLRDDDVDQAVARIVEALSARHGAILRA